MEHFYITSYDVWKADVEKITKSLSGKSTADFTDLPYWDLWTWDVDPVQLAAYVVCFQGDTPDVAVHITPGFQKIKHRLTWLLNSRHVCCPDMSTNTDYTHKNY